MKVALLHIRHRGTGGTERYMSLLAARLAQAGHEVTIVCRSHEDAPHPDVRFVVLTRPVLGSAWRLAAFAKDVDKHLAATHYDVVYNLGRTPTQDVIRLGGGCHATYLELAHEQTLRPWEKLGGRRIKNRIVLANEAKALAPGAFLRVITNSELVKRDVIARYGVPDELVTVIYNAVDVDRFRPADDGREADRERVRAEAGLAPEDFVVLFLGTSYGRKGLDRLLAAFAPATAKRPDVKLLVVGYDGRGGVWTEEARRLGIADRTRFLGGRRDAEACFAASDLYVLPTRYDPFANSTLEALATGLPVITTVTNGGHEILAPGVHGTAIGNSDDPAELETALRAWLEPGVAREARSACRALAERFDAPRLMDESVRVLEEVRRAKLERAGTR